MAKFSIRAVGGVEDGKRSQKALYSSGNIKGI